MSPEPGTTRDPIDAVVDLDGEPFRVWDTAGIRRASRVDEATEFYSVQRARQALAEADIALLVADATQGITQQEQRLAEEIADAGVGLIVLLNKWDAADPDAKEIGRGRHRRPARLRGLGPGAAGLGAQRGPAAPAAGGGPRRARGPPLPGAHPRVEPPHPGPGRRPTPPRPARAAGPASCTPCRPGAEPPTFVLFVRGGELSPDYLRFLEGRLRGEYDFLGTPLRLVARSGRRDEDRPRE